MVLLSIPLWFFGVDFAVYGLCSFFAFLVAYFANTISQVSGKRSHYHLFISFALLGAGMLAVSLSSLMIFIQPYLGITFPESVTGLDEVGYWIYYITSLGAYGLLAYTYLSESKPEFMAALLPSWPLVYSHFNLISLVLLSFTLLHMVINFFSKKNFNCLLILVGFSLIALHHLLLLFMPFTDIIYLVSHFLLIVGFSLLVVVLRRVGR
jgi:hypothetical protein